MSIEDVPASRKDLSFRLVGEIGLMWGEKACQWAAKNKSEGEHLCQIRKRVAELVGHLSSDSVVLELASGANNKAYYPGEFNFRRVIATDISEEMLTLLAKTNLGIENRMVADARVTLPFLSNSVDTALCFFGMRYFENQEEVLRELIRVTKPGGHIGIADYDSYVYEGAVCVFDPCRLQGAVLADGHFVTVKQLSQPLLEGSPILYFLTIGVKK